VVPYRLRRSRTSMEVFMVLDATVRPVHGRHPGVRFRRSRIPDVRDARF
jgi:hypothetical protein